MIRVGQKIGRIRIEERMGGGGMGAVFVGFDEKLQRRVALKAIRSDRLNAVSRRRFLAEARILSQLDHPNICRLYDFLEGEEQDFLVLELIRGRTLREALASGIEPRDRLRIAEQVARALAAAHEKGVIHRDLKPDNVMLTEAMEAKVLDFGLARVDDVSGAESSPEPLAAPASPPGSETVWEIPQPAWVPSQALQTEQGLAVGTPSAMSPEQARGKPVTAASDVYSLGLLLQELFTGRPAYEPDLSQPLLLVKAIDGDSLPLEGVKDPDLAALIRRLKSLVPEARPTAAEAAARLAWIRGKPRRRRRRLLAAAVLAVFVLGGVKYILDLRRERRLALEARNEAEQVTGFLVDLFRVSDPQQGRGPTITAREILDQGAGRLDRELAGQPRVKARMLQTIGTVYQQLGLYDKASPLLERALKTRRKLFGPESPEVAESLESLGRLAERQGRYAPARPLLERSLALREAALGPQDPQVAQSLDALAQLAFSQGDYPRARSLWQRALALREKALGPRHPRVAEVLDRLALTELRAGEDAAAEKLFQRALALRQQALGSRHPQVAESLANLANFYRQHGDPAKAEPLYRQALAVNEAILGPDHPTVARNLYNLGLCRIDVGDFPGAADLLRRALDIQRQSLGPDHPEVASSLNSLATLYQRQGDAARAEPLYRQALAVQERALGSDHPSVGYTLMNLGLLLSDRGDLAAAETLYRRAIAIWEKRFGPEHPLVLQALNNLADLRRRRRDPTGALVLYQCVLDASRKSLAADPSNSRERHRVAQTLVELGELQRDAGQAARAAASWREAATLMAPLTAHSEAVDFLDTHARALLYLGRTGEARPLVEALLARGWNDAEFLALCRRRRLCPR
jgi:tetratricopeptide (TPR) repeat protein